MPGKPLHIPPHEFSCRCVFPAGEESVYDYIQNTVGVHVQCMGSTKPPVNIFYVHMFII